MPKRPREHRRRDPERRELRPAEMADDRRVDEEVERLGGERAERRDASLRISRSYWERSRIQARGGGLVRCDVVRHHPLRREALHDLLPQHGRVERVGALEHVLGLAPVVDDDPRATVVDHLGHGAPAGRDHRRPAGHRLDHHEPERLLPRDREERRARVLEQLDLLPVRHLADVLDGRRRGADGRARRSTPARPARRTCRRSSAAARPRARS